MTWLTELEWLPQGLCLAVVLVGYAVLMGLIYLPECE